MFPISNWTELDVWQYIHLENIPIVPLYFSAKRPVVERDGALIMVDDERMPLKVGEVPELRSVRFRTLGCYPLTGAVESEATTLPQIIQEMLLTTSSERQGRMIDHDAAASMETQHGPQPLRSDGLVGAGNIVERTRQRARFLFGGITLGNGLRERLH